MKIPLFDIDGTLVKTASPINQDVFKFAVKKVYGVDANHQEINPEGMVDNQILVDILKLHGLREEQIKEKIDEEIKTVEDYSKQHESEIKLEVLPGVVNLLEKLKDKNVPMGILSGNVEGLAWAKLKAAGLRDFFTFGAFGSSTFLRKELVEKARLNAQIALGKEFKTEDFVIVGDTPKDVECARDNGIKVVVIATGRYSYEELKASNPDLLVSNLEEEGEKVLEFLNN